MNIKQISIVVLALNDAILQVIKDKQTKDFKILVNEAEPLESIVELVIANPAITADELSTFLNKPLVDKGWTAGEDHDEKSKTTPQLLPLNQQPAELRYHIQSVINVINTLNYSN